MVIEQHDTGSSPPHFEIDNNALDNVIASHTQRNQLERWQQMLLTWRQLDAERFARQGKVVFEKLATHNLGCKGKRGKYNRINTPVVELLKQAFQWPEREQTYREIFTGELCDVIFGRHSSIPDEDIDNKIARAVKRNNLPIHPVILILGLLAGAYIISTVRIVVLGFFEAYLGK